MADEGDVLTDLDMGGAPEGNGADTAPTVAIITQYVKDLSVENPNAPACFQWTDQPQVDLQFNIGANKVSDEVHEIELKVKANARSQGGSLYIVELAYCGLVGLRNLPDDHLHAFLYAEGPRILFPFARQVMAEATGGAGFPPLLIDPIDFGALYQQQLAARAQAQGDEMPAPAGNA